MIRIIIFIVYFMLLTPIVTLIVSILSIKVRKSNPAYKNFYKIFDHDLNPHWYTYNYRKSYLLRGIQFISAVLSILSPTENIKSYFSIINPNKTISTKAHEEYISPAYITEIMTLLNLIFVFIVSINFNNIIGFHRCLFSFYIIFEMVILFDRITYKSFLKMVFYPDRKVHNIGRSIVIFALNYLYFVVGFTVIYQNEFFLFSKKMKVFLDYLYFSVSTITTLGYGDIAPINLPGRVTVIFEAIIGIWLLGIAIGKFIGSLKNPIEQE